MKFEDGFCTPEQAKELDELGVKAKSYMVWAYEICVTIGKDELVLVTRAATFVCVGASYRDIFPAYSCAELGVLLGKYNCQSLGGVLEAKFRADKLIILIKEKIIKPEALKL